MRTIFEGSCAWVTLGISMACGGIVAVSTSRDVVAADRPLKLPAPAFATDIDVSQDGRRLLITAEGRWRQVDSNTGMPIDGYRGHAVHSARYALNPPAAVSIGVDANPGIAIDLASMTPLDFDLRTIVESDHFWAFNGSEIARYIGAEDGNGKIEVRRWDGKHPTTTIVSGSVFRSLAISQKSKYVAAITGRPAGDDMAVSVYDAKGGQRIDELLRDPGTAGNTIACQFEQVRFADNDTAVVVIGSSGGYSSAANRYQFAVLAYTIGDKHERWSFRSANCRYSGIYISPDTSLVAVSLFTEGDDKGLADDFGQYHKYAIVVFNAANGREVARLFGVSELITKVAISPDARKVYAITEREPAVLVWELPRPVQK